MHIIPKCKTVLTFKIKIFDKYFFVALIHSNMHIHQKFQIIWYTRFCCITVDQLIISFSQIL
jgi:hypothetical protein